MSNEIRDVLAEIEAELRVLLNEAPYLSGRESGLSSAVDIVRARREALSAASDQKPWLDGFSLVVDSRLPEGYAALVSAQAPCSSERATAGTLSETFWYDGAWSDAMSEAGFDWRRPFATPEARRRKRGFGTRSASCGRCRTRTRGLRGNVPSTEVSMQYRRLLIDGVELEVAVVSRGGELVVDDYGACWRIVGDAPAGSVDAQEEPVVSVQPPVAPPVIPLSAESPPKALRGRGRKR